MSELHIRKINDDLYEAFSALCEELEVSRVDAIRAFFELAVRKHNTPGHRLSKETLLNLTDDGHWEPEWTPPERLDGTLVPPHSPSELPKPPEQPPDEGTPF
jgi:hypothetical protein